MKKGILAAAAALIVAASVQAQSTVDSIAAKYKLLPMPGARTIEHAFPVIGNYQLENSTENTGTVTVSLDSSNKGIVWVEGLPQGRIKAYLRKSPGTYRVIPQKTESGRQIQEGTMHYDTTSRQLHIALGKAYDETDPTAVFASSMNNATAGTSDEATVETASGGSKTKAKSSASKAKTKVQYYTATKVMPDNMMMNDTQMQQQSDSTGQEQTNQQQ